MSSDGVTSLTARKDLHGLEAAGYLQRRRVGHADRIFATELLSSLTAGHE